MSIETEPAPCPDDEHEWEYKSDWAGDPGVINGTYDIHWLECCICGATKEATLDDVPDYDDYM